MAKKTAIEKGLTVTARMYQVGELGDCFLLHFRDKGEESHVLIDCGSFRNSEKSKKRLQAIVSHIQSDLKEKKLDVVIGTHQHNDHVSGFVHCEEQFSGLVEQVWLSWLDNPNDDVAANIYKERKRLTGQLFAFQKKVASLGLGFDDGNLSEVLGFFGASGTDPDVPAKGIEILKRIGRKKVKYLPPGMILDLPGLPPGAVKVYVLGPPIDKTLLLNTNAGKGESYDPHLAIANTHAGKLLDALDNWDPHTRNRLEVQFPFKAEFKKFPHHAEKGIKTLYSKQPWRKIDTDWLDQANRLALYLDSYTNNSSLVLAFELVSSGKVLLFVGDAQTGSWLSWEDIQWKDAPGQFKTYDLLQNTVLYKVGHHASHNATLKKAFEAMNHDELIAMIPVDRTDPNINKRKNGWKMPASNLYQRLKEKTKYRVLRMDDGFADGCHPTRNKAKCRWDELSPLPRINRANGYVEFTVKG